MDEQEKRRELGSEDDRETSRTSVTVPVSPVWRMGRTVNCGRSTVRLTVKPQAPEREKQTTWQTNFKFGSRKGPRRGALLYYLHSPEPIPSPLKGSMKCIIKHRPI